jgi:hypothetical protein
MRSTNARSSSPTWTNIGDEVFSSIANNAKSMHVTTDGWIYLADNGMGVVMGYPA